MKYRLLSILLVPACVAPGAGDAISTRESESSILEFGFGVNNDGHVACTLSSPGVANVCDIPKSEVIKIKLDSSWSSSERALLKTLANNAVFLDLAEVVENFSLSIGDGACQVNDPAVCVFLGKAAIAPNNNNASRPIADFTRMGCLDEGPNRFASGSAYTYRDCSRWSALFDFDAMMAWTGESATFQSALHVRDTLGYFSALAIGLGAQSTSGRARAYTSANRSRTAVASVPLCAREICRALSFLPGTGQLTIATSCANQGCN